MRTDYFDCFALAESLQLRQYGVKSCLAAWSDSVVRCKRIMGAVENIYFYPLILREGKSNRSSDEGQCKAVTWRATLRLNSGPQLLSSRSNGLVDWSANIAIRDGMAECHIRLALSEN